jgi:hypothetical protein
MPGVIPHHDIAWLSSTRQSTRNRMTVFDLHSILRATQISVCGDTLVLTSWDTCFETEHSICDASIRSPIRWKGDRPR